MKPHSQTAQGPQEKISVSRPHLGQIFSVIVLFPRIAPAPGHLFAFAHPSRISPSVPSVTIRHWMNLPEFFNAPTAACSMPPQQGTSISTTARDLMLFPSMNSVSFSV
jgi:hypothetical protein